MKLNITLTDWDYTCEDGCCTTFGTKTEVNGVEIDSHISDRTQLIELILLHLGYDVEVNERCE